MLSFEINILKEKGREEREEGRPVSYLSLNR